MGIFIDRLVAKFIRQQPILRVHKESLESFFPKNF